MLDKTLGYILCCQSPALFLAALALLVAYLAGRKHKVRAFFAAADARREQKAAIREENERLAREAQEAAEAAQVEPAPQVPAAPEAFPQEPLPQAALEPAADSIVETPVPESEQPQK